MGMAWHSAYSFASHILEPWRRSRTRRLVKTSKFFLFDNGIANYLHPEVKKIVEGSDLYGQAFEHFLIQEVRAFLSYRQLDRPIAYWRTSSGFEVDLIAGDMDMAIEFKAVKFVRDPDLKGIRALKEEHRVKRALVVTREERPRRTDDGIDLIPWREFCSRLWSGDLLSR